MRAITVDSGNRKWVGTDNGLWLFSEEGENIIAQFTTANSPLPANKIQDITINQNTGEVFISTELGLVSFRGTATETKGKPDCAVVFPNPVRPGYTGLVGISGLANNALVKITDVAGNLVYQAQATGGTLAWDLRDVKGKRVKSGVYLAFSSTPNGKQSCTSKIAVIGQ
ncbi:MAG: T9SS type A sorting domain-containing protein [Adhaeribacter sp.]